MATATDLWFGYGSLGTPAATISESGIVSLNNPTAGNAVRHRRTLQAIGGSHGVLTFEARCFWGAGYAFVEWNGAYNLMGGVVIDSSEWKTYSCPFALQPYPDVSTITFGFGFWGGAVGSIEVRKPLIDLPGLLLPDQAGTSPTQLASTGRKATLHNAGALVVSGSGTSYSDGSAERQIQTHGNSSNTTGFSAGYWGDNPASPVISSLKSRGVEGTHAAVQSGDDLGTFQSKGSDGSSFVTTVAFAARVDGPVSPGLVPGQGRMDVRQRDGSTQTLLSGGSRGNVSAGYPALLPPTATSGFLYIPACNGIPTGVPEETLGAMIPMVWDRVNHKMYCFSGGAWRPTS